MDQTGKGLQFLLAPGMTDICKPRWESARGKPMPGKVLDDAGQSCAMMGLDIGAGMGDHGIWTRCKGPSIPADNGIFPP